MSLAANTGRTRRVACPLCGVDVEQREWTTLCGDKVVAWSSERHDAPCGLPCMGGGVGSETIRPMRQNGLGLRDVTHGSAVSTGPSGDTLRLPRTCPRCGDVVVANEEIDTVARAAKRSER